jgi:hypothetical protein
MPDRVGLDLTEGTLQGNPGVPVVATLLVTNRGNLVDRVRVRVEGLDASWYQLSAGEVGLLPNQQQSVQLVIRVPAELGVGAHAFRVVAVSRADPTHSASVVATLTVVEGAAIGLALVPQRQVTRRTARYVARIRNTGNADADLTIVAGDDAEQLDFAVEPDQLHVGAQSETTATVTVRARRSSIAGREQEHTFAVAALPASDPLAPRIATSQGQLVHRPLLAALAGLPGGLLRPALLALLLLLGLGLLIWFLGAPGRRFGVPPAVETPTAAVLANGADTETGNGEARGAPLAAADQTPAAPLAQEGASARGHAPVIGHFGLDLSSDQAPPDVPLTWDVSDAQRIDVNRHVLEPGALVGSAAVEYAEYELHAANDDGEAQQLLDLYILRPPAIEDFEYQVAQSGDTVTLTWKTNLAAHVFLNDEQLQGENGTIQVPYDPTTTYVLRAENVGGEATQNLMLAPAPTAAAAESPSPIDTPRPTATATSTPTSRASNTPTPAVEASAVVGVSDTPAPSDTPQPTETPELTDTPELTASATETSPPTPTATATVTRSPMLTSTATATRTATATPCPRLGPVTLGATPGGGAVKVAWNAVGGCGPYTGDVRADYPYVGTGRDVGVSSASGSFNDSPPAHACGDYTVDYHLTIQDSSGQSGNATTSVTLAGGTCQPPAPGTTSPTIQVDISPPPNGAGWNNSNLSVKWTVTDPGGSIGSTTGCQTVVETQETAGTTLTCSATDVDGKSSSDSVTIKIDKTAPSISASATTADPSPYTPGTWTNEDVTVHFTCADTLSGIASCPSDRVVNTEGANQSVSGVATDLAGNSASATLPGIDVDQTPPMTTAAASPAPINGTIVVVPATITLTSTDALSGVKTLTYEVNGGAAVSVAGNTASVVATTDGTINLTFFATDVAGNVEATKSATFTVQRPVIDLTLAGTGGGSVTLTPQNSPTPAAACTSSCAPEFNAGTTVILAETPNSTSSFLGWSGPDAGSCGTSSTCQVAVTTSRSITATFALNPLLSVADAGGGIVAASPPGTAPSGQPGGIVGCGSAGAACDARFPMGSTVTLSETPNNGYSFDHWLVDNASTVGCAGAALTPTPIATPVATGCPLRVTMNADHSVEAVFDLDLVVAVQGPSTNPTLGPFGTVVSTPTGINCTFTGGQCLAAFAVNAPVTLTASGQVDGGVVDSVFAGYTSSSTALPSSCAAQSGSPPPTTCTFTAPGNLNSSMEVVASFDPLEALAVGATGNNSVTLSPEVAVSDSPINYTCSSSCSYRYPYGTSVTVTASGTDPFWAIENGSNSTFTAAANSTSTVIQLATRYAQDPLLTDYTLTGQDVEIVPSEGPEVDEPIQSNSDTSLTVQDSPSNIVLPAGGQFTVGCVATANCTSAALSVVMNEPHQLESIVPVVPAITVRVVGTPATPPVAGLPAGATLSGDLFFASLEQSSTPAAPVLGSGSVSMGATGLNCRSQCSARFPLRQLVTLTATPDKGSTFAGWSGIVPASCTPDSGPAPVTCRMSARASGTVTATFRAGRELQVALAGTGQGTVLSTPDGITCPGSCSASFEDNSELTLVAQPAAGSLFAGWQGADVPSSCDASSAALLQPCTLAPGASTQVIATFIPAPASPRVTVVVQGAGAVASSPAGLACPPTCSAAFPIDSTVQLIARADASSGATFLGWSGAAGDATAQCGGPSICTLRWVIDQDTALTATFSWPTPMPSPSPSASGTVTRTATPTATATPSPAATFASTPTLTEEPGTPQQPLAAMTETPTASATATQTVVAAPGTLVARTSTPTPSAVVLVPPSPTGSAPTPKTSGSTHTGAVTATPTVAANDTPVPTRPLPPSPTATISPTPAQATPRRSPRRGRFFSARPKTPMARMRPSPSTRDRRSAHA